MKTIKINLYKKYLEQIKTGQKTVEGRVNTNKYRNIQSNDTIIFFEKDSPTTKAVCKIIKINHYKNFKDMLINEGIENMLPGIKSLDEAINIYNNLPGYKEKVKEYGAIAIQLKLPPF